MEDCRNFVHRKICHYRNIHTIVTSLRFESEYPRLKPEIKKELDTALENGDYVKVQLILDSCSEIEFLPVWKLRDMCRLAGVRGFSVISKGSMITILQELEKNAKAASKENEGDSVKSQGSKETNITSV